MVHLVLGLRVRENWVEENMTAAALSDAGKRAVGATSIVAQRKDLSWQARRAFSWITTTRLLTTAPTFMPDVLWFLL